MHQPMVRCCLQKQLQHPPPICFCCQWKLTNRMGVSTPQFNFPKGSLLHWYTCSHLLMQFISFWVIPLQLFMKSHYKVGCKLIWVQKLSWIAGGGRCEVGNSPLNQLCYTRNSGNVSKVIFSLATFVCLMSLNSQTGHRTWWEKKLQSLSLTSEQPFHEATLHWHCFVKVYAGWPR